MALSLTARQAEILEQIEVFTEVNGYPPSSRELSAACGLGGPSGAHRMISTLERKGFVERTHGQSRGLVVTHPAVDFSTLSPGDVIRLITIAELHSVFSDLELAMAVGCKPLEVRGSLITDARRRNRRMAALEAMFGEQLADQPDVSEYLEPLRTVVLSADTDRWCNFLVDQCVFNRVFASLCDTVASEDVMRRAVLWPDISIGRAAADTAEKWLRDLLAEEPSLDTTTRDRAEELGQGIAAMLSSITNVYGEGDFSVTFVPMTEALLAPLDG